MLSAPFISVVVIAAKNRAVTYLPVQISSADSIGRSVGCHDYARKVDLLCLVQHVLWQQDLSVLAVLRYDLTQITRM